MNEFSLKMNSIRPKPFSYLFSQPDEWMVEPEHPFWKDTEQSIGPFFPREYENSFRCSLALICRLFSAAHIQAAHAKIIITQKNKSNKENLRWREKRNSADRKYENFVENWSGAMALLCARRFPDNKKTKKRRNKWKLAHNYLSSRSELFFKRKKIPAFSVCCAAHKFPLKIVFIFQLFLQTTLCQN